MRLIDADKLYPDCLTKNARLAISQSQIAKAPTVEERPQGEWKETGYETGALGITYRQTQCSNCGWEHALPMWLNYCPSCGAKMRCGAKNE